MRRLSRAGYAGASLQLRELRGAERASEARQQPRLWLSRPVTAARRLQTAKQALAGQNASVSGFAAWLCCPGCALRGPAPHDEGTSPPLLLLRTLKRATARPFAQPACRQVLFDFASTHRCTQLCKRRSPLSANPMSWRYGSVLVVRSFGLVDHRPTREPHSPVCSTGSPRHAFPAL